MRDFKDALSFQEQWESKEKTMRKRRGAQYMRAAQRLSKEGTGVNWRRKRKKEVVQKWHKLRTNFSQLEERPFFVNTLKPQGLKKKKAEAVLHARFTFSNTHLNLRDFEGNTLLKLSAGTIKNLKKSTPFANSLLGEKFGQMCRAKGFNYLEFISEGTSRNRKTLFRGLTKAGLQFFQITVKTGLPHNGCRSASLRRL